MNLAKPDPFYILETSLEDFILGLLCLGRITEISLVGVFEDAETKGRGSLRDIELPLHQDGIYSKKLAEAQGGHYVERPNIDIVGLYCLRDGDNPCYTTISEVDVSQLNEISLCKGNALVFDNRRVVHGRRGRVGKRLLLRFWITEHQSGLSK